MRIIRYQSRLKALRISGFLIRMSKKTGKKILNKRRKKGRTKLTLLSK